MDSDRELTWLRRVRDLSHRMTSAEPEELLALILDSAIEISEAERGYLVLVRADALGKPRLKVVEARGYGGVPFSLDEAQVSRTIVQRVLRKDAQGVVTTSDDDRDLLEVSSVRARQVVSALCAPLRLRGETRGVLYLDHRVERGVFSELDLACMRAFADQAALALETMELHGLNAEWTAPARELFGKLVGGSPAMTTLYDELEQASRSWETVLLLGEPGVGKRAAARELHARSTRAGEPLLELPLDAGPRVPIELLGARRGFEGEPADHVGHLVLAGAGTLILHEVGRLTPELQAALLEVLTRGEVTPLGGRRPVPVRCRVIATSSADLRALCDAGQFRPELYYRLDVLRIVVPPLRQRPEDLPALIEHVARDAGRRGPKPSSKAARLLGAYTWPGNVRELENEVRRWLAQDVTRVGVNHLAPEIREGRGLAVAPRNYSGLTLSEIEREVVREALEACQQNKARAARKLGIPRSTLYHLIERHGIEPG